MLPRRYTRSDEGSAFTDSERHLILAAETLRTGDSAGKRPRDGEKADEKASMFWRVFGGTILSIAALMFFNAYQSLANNIHEARNDLGRMREVSGRQLLQLRERLAKLEGLQEAKPSGVKAAVATEPAKQP